MVCAVGVCCTFQRRLLACCTNHAVRTVTGQIYPPAPSLTTSPIVCCASVENPSGYCTVSCVPVVVTQTISTTTPVTSFSLGLAGLSVGGVFDCQTA